GSKQNQMGQSHDNLDCPNLDETNIVVLSASPLHLASHQPLTDANSSHSGLGEYLSSQPKLRPSQGLVPK
ncbi:hypothetical protein KIL84_001043, partial [Mauremys mutica]